jgi:hypothetical protein
MYVYCLIFGFHFFDVAPEGWGIFVYPTEISNVDEEIGSVEMDITSWFNIAFPWPNAPPEYLGR